MELYRGCTYTEKVRIWRKAKRLLILCISSRSLRWMYAKLGLWVVDNACGFSHCHRWGQCLRPRTACLALQQLQAATPNGTYSLIKTAVAMYETKAFLVRLWHMTVCDFLEAPPASLCHYVCSFWWEHSLPMDMHFCKSRQRASTWLFCWAPLSDWCGWHIWLLQLKKFTLQALQCLKRQESQAPSRKKKCKLQKKLTERNHACGHSRPKHVVTGDRSTFLQWCTVNAEIKGRSLPPPPPPISLVGTQGYQRFPLFKPGVGILPGPLAY